MSDIRFIIIGTVLIFAGFVVLGGFGQDYQTATFEADEFGTCYQYSNDLPPIEINCSFKIFDQVMFFGIVMSFIGLGIIAMIKGVTGKWDNQVKPEDMVGPGKNQTDDSDKE